MSFKVIFDGNPVLKKVLEEKGDYYAVLGIVSEFKSDSEQKLGSFPYKSFKDIEFRVPIEKGEYEHLKEKLKECIYGVVLIREGMLEITLRD